MPKKKRTPPRKKALDRRQASQQLSRYERLLQQWLTDLGTAARKVEVYRRKVSYYSKRVQTLLLAEIAAAERDARAAEVAMGRAARSIDFGDD